MECSALGLLTLFSLAKEGDPRPAVPLDCSVVHLMPPPAAPWYFPLIVLKGRVKPRTPPPGACWLLPQTQEQTPGCCPLLALYLDQLHQCLLHLGHPGDKYHLVQEALCLRFLGGNRCAQKRLPAGFEGAVRDTEPYCGAGRRGLGVEHSLKLRAVTPGTGPQGQ